MRTSEKIKRDMAKCAKRVSEVIECFCEAGELVGCAQDARYELIGGISCIRQLEQEIKQKDERIRQMEREKEAAVADLSVTKDCKVCKYVKGAAHEDPCRSCGIVQHHWEWRGVEEDA